jgi:serine protease Do
MEVRDRTDNFWKVFSVILLVIMVGLVGVIVWQGQDSRPAFYEGKPARAKGSLASLAPSLKAGSDLGRYWVSDLADGALPYVVNIQTIHKAPKATKQSAEDTQEMLRRFHQMLPFDMQDMSPEEMQQFSMPQGAPEDSTGVGSGFVVREDGYIVTNSHVTNGADEFTVTFPDGKKLTAKLVGKDDFKDIAVLKVDSKTKLPVAHLGDSSETRIGEPVIAIGSPIGFSATVTAGIVSANNRSVADLRGLDEAAGSEDIRKPQHYLQTDAAINRGNSGGPLINSDGEVIGVNQAIARKDMVNPMTGEWIPIEGIGFAIPIDEVKDTITQIVEHGSVKYPGISASIQDVKAYLEQYRDTDLKLDVKEGVYVVKVMIGGPADKAGIKAGDVILSIDGKKSSTANDFIKMLNQHKVGQRVTLRVARQGGKQQEDVSVVLEALDLSKQP